MDGHTARTAHAAAPVPVPRSMWLDGANPGERSAAAANVMADAANVAGIRDKA